MDKRYKHGKGYDHRLYRIWHGMRNRCESVNHTAYLRYGGKGISVCTEWKDFPTFEKWALNNSYDENLTIDRKDNNKGYQPDNCRWVTYTQQARNKSDIVYDTVRGEKLLLVEIGEKYDIPYMVINSRYYNYGHRGDDLIKPVKKAIEVVVNGETHTLKEIAHISGLSYSAITHRYRKGLRGSALIQPMTRRVRA